MQITFSRCASTTRVSGETTTLQQFSFQLRPLFAATMDLDATTQIAFGIAATILAVLGIFAAYHNRQCMIDISRDALSLSKCPCTHEVLAASYRSPQPTLPLHTRPSSTPPNHRFFNLAALTTVTNVLLRNFRARYQQVYELPGEDFEALELQRPATDNSHNSLVPRAPLLLAHSTVDTIHVEPTTSTDEPSIEIQR